jgi:TRAP-type C4-dicarboxylate transport system permease small subunit
MNTITKTTEMKDRKVILSTLWIFAMFNYIYADIFLSFFSPAAQQETMPFTEGAVLGFAVLMETAIAMVLLSRVLKYTANRWTNIIAGVLHTAAVAWTLSGGTPAPYYIFFAAIEIACTLFIIWYAWKWRSPESHTI